MNNKSNLPAEQLLECWSITRNKIECMLTVSKINIRDLDCYLFEHFEDGKRIDGTVHNDKQRAINKFETIKAFYQVL